MELFKNNQAYLYLELLVSILMINQLVLSITSLQLQSKKIEKTLQKKEEIICKDLFVFNDSSSKELFPSYRYQRCKVNNREFLRIR